MVFAEIEVFNELLSKDPISRENEERLREARCVYMWNLRKPQMAYYVSELLTQEEGQESVCCQEEPFEEELGDCIHEKPLP